jgi:hypothetical protein
VPQRFLELESFLNALTDFFSGSPQMGPQEADHGLSMADSSHSSFFGEPSVSGAPLLAAKQAIIFHAGVNTSNPVFFAKVGSK